MKKNKIFFAGVLCLSIIIFFILAGEWCDADEVKQVLTTKSVITSLAISPDGRMVAFVAKEKGESVLQVKNLWDANPLRVITRLSRIDNLSFFGDTALLCQCDGKRLTLHDIATGISQDFGTADRFVASHGQKKILVKNGDVVQVIDTVSGKKRLFRKDCAGFEFCDWSAGMNILACRDGSFWKIGEKGNPELLLQGHAFAPWYIDAKVSPDGRRIFLVSDDTKNDIGEGGRSIWIMESAAQTAKSISPGGEARWVGSRMLVVSSRGTLMFVDAFDSCASERLYDKGGLGYFDAGGDVVIYSVNNTDEDGLYSGSSVFLVSLTDREEK